METVTNIDETREADGIKTCPFCAEEIKTAALVCRHCRTDLRDSDKGKRGTYVRIRVIVGEKTYAGDIFVPEYMNRLSDVINEKKRFIVLTNAVEENHVRDVPIGFLAINKSQAERLELINIDEEKPFEVISRIIEWR
jgi:hypothetical protein